MVSVNCTVVSELMILGFHHLHNYRIAFFFFLLIIYILTCLENILIIVLVTTSTHLHTPMYTLLSLLSICEILYTTNFVPKMLHDNLLIKGRSSVIGCIAQLNIFATIGSVDCLLYALMSFDRYLAISKPLRYSAIIDNRHCVNLVIFFLFLSFIPMLFISILLSQLEFCGSNVIDHFYCDFGPLIALTYSDITLVTQMTLLCSALFTLFPLILIILSYISILYTIVKIQSAVGRKKAFSTCSSHLLVVAIYYGTLISLYVAPAGANAAHVNKGLSFVYIVVTPFINPIIYTLRNKDIHKALEMKIAEIKRILE